MNEGNVNALVRYTRTVKKKTNDAEKDKVEISAMVVEYCNRSLPWYRRTCCIVERSYHYGEQRCQKP